MASSQSASGVPADEEFTVQQAADVLSVSQSFLIGLLYERQIEVSGVGMNSRIDTESLLAYLCADDRRRSQVADELTLLNEEMGLL